MLFHIAKEDCSGGPVVSDAAVTVKRDECGVCGGTGDTCVDCLGLPNGGELNVLPDVYRAQQNNRAKVA